MKIFKTEKGYYYKVSNNRKIRISKDEYNSKSKKKGGTEEYFPYEHLLNIYHNTYNLIEHDTMKIGVISSIKVKEGCRGKGIGKKIINEMLKTLSYIIISNSIANDFWRKFEYIHCDSYEGKKITNIVKEKLKGGYVEGCSYILVGNKKM